MESVITECPYICAPNIMDTPDFSTKMVQLDMSGGSCIKAGTPISADGKVANDETAIGILLNDCHSCLGNARGLVVIGGRIKQDVAKNHSGITISDKAKAAMINVTFTGDGARAGGGGGTITRLVKTGNTATREDGSAITPQEALDAFLAGPVLLKTDESQGHASWHTIVDVFFDAYASTLTTISLAYLSLQTSTQRERVTIST
nr:MAG TPA: hypothetical protein [Bacteriophage sp.]